VSSIARPRVLFMFACAFNNTMRLAAFLLV
jgi:hypothetical protein